MCNKSEMTYVSPSIFFDILKVYGIIFNRSKVHLTFLGTPSGWKKFPKFYKFKFCMKKGHFGGLAIAARGCWGWGKSVLRVAPMFIYNYQKKFLKNTFPFPLYRLGAFDTFPFNFFQNGILLTFRSKSDTFKFITQSFFEIIWLFQRTVKGV